MENTTYSSSGTSKEMILTIGINDIHFIRYHSLLLTHMTYYSLSGISKKVGQKTYSLSGTSKKVGHKIHLLLGTSKKVGKEI